MSGWIDRLGVLVLDASLGATLLIASIAPALVRFAIRHGIATP